MKQLYEAVNASKELPPEGWEGSSKFDTELGPVWRHSNWIDVKNDHNAGCDVIWLRPVEITEDKLKCPICGKKMTMVCMDCTKELCSQYRTEITEEGLKRIIIKHFYPSEFAYSQTVNIKSLEKQKKIRIKVGMKTKFGDDAVKALMSYINGEEG